MQASPSDRDGTARAGLPPLRTGPWTSSHVVRWCAAQQNWDRIHHDADYARQVAGLPGCVINGALKQNLLVRYLQERFGDGAWPWRVHWNAIGLDLVGQRLEIGGCVRGERRHDGLRLVEVDLWILNPDAQSVTTRGGAVVALDPGGGAIADALSMRNEACALDEDGMDPAGVPAQIASRIGRQLERVQSCVPLELGRLRLFADALGLRTPMHHDVQAGAASVHGAVVAPAWFPVHALAAPPGERELSTDARALGREGVCEVGRNLPHLFDLPPHGLRSCGNRAQFHSLLRLGETVLATSRLASVKAGISPDGRPCYWFVTANEYCTTTGRPLLSELTALACTA